MKTPFKKKITYKSKPLTVYSVGWLAVLVNRHIQTVREWEYKGVLPRPLFQVDDTGTRYYSAAELIGYSSILNSNARPRGWKAKTDWDGLQQKLAAYKKALLSALTNGHSEAYKEALPNESSMQARFGRAENKDIKALAHRLITKPSNAK